MIASAIPGWFFDATHRTIRCEVDGRTWTSNGHALIVCAPDAAPPSWAVAAPADVAEWIAAAVRATPPETIGAPCVYVVAGRSGEDIANYVAEMNGGVYALAYVALAETLFPGCAWHVPSGEDARANRAAAYAVLDGQTVMILAAGAKTPERARGLAKDGGAS